MKRIYLLLLMTFIAVSSCKKKSDNPDNGEQQTNPEISVLPQTIAMTSGGETRTYTITYQENTAKIDKITETGGNTEMYLYNGELISKKYNGTDEATSEDYDVYEYVSGRLTKEQAYRRGKSEAGITEFSYSETKTIVTGDELEGGKVELGYDGKGNLTNLELFADGTSAAQISITYDDKNAPFRNVSGWGEIRYLVAVPLGDNIGFEDILATGNNPLKVTGSMMGETVDVTYSYEFKDSKNPKFPTKVAGTVKVAEAVTNTFEAEITYR